METEFEIIFYQREDGMEPVREFLDAQPLKMRAKLVKEINMLKMNGYELREPYSKHLRGGIFEIRAKAGNDISRVLYFFYMGHRIVLTNGFVKKTQMTPKGEIEKAEKYRKDYLRGGNRMSNFDAYFNEQMKDKEFKKEYESLEPEFAIVQAMIDARREQGLTQKDLSRITGMAQGDISKLERGSANPSLRTLKRLADGLGLKLKIEFCK